MSEDNRTGTPKKANTRHKRVKAIFKHQADGRGIIDMLEDEYSLKIDDGDLRGRRQIWVHSEGQTLFINIEDKVINVNAWADRPVRKKVFKLNRRKPPNE